MKLIDADELLKTFTVNSDGRRILEKDCDNFDITISLKEIKRIIREQPTAYDLNKVIGGLYGLKRYENKYDSYYESSMYHMAKIKNDTINSAIDEVIKIVKAGGIE